MTSHAAAVRTRPDRDVGLALAAAHLVLVAFLILAVRGSLNTSEGWGGMLPAGALFVIDIPFSLLYFLWPALSQGIVGPAVIHGILGTAWYYALPHLIRRLRW